MAYTDVVTIAEAKQFLRVDDGFTADDDLIQLLINTAGEYVERHTNHILFPRDKTYVVVGGEKRVYDYPVTAVLDPADSGDYEVTNYETYDVYELSQESMTLTVGYSNTDDVPAGLKLEMLNIIDNMYQGNENEDDSDRIDRRLAKYKRHII